MRSSFGKLAIGNAAAALLLSVSHIPLVRADDPAPKDIVPAKEGAPPTEPAQPTEATPSADAPSDSPATDAAADSNVAKRARVETVTVTARRRVENIQKVPVAATAFSEPKLIERNMKTVEDVARETPSLNIQSRIGDSTQKTFALRGQIQNDALVTLDPSVGIYLNDQYISRSAGANLDFFDVDRVEILAGPQGTLYGRNTTGGAIKVITAEPDTSEPFSGYVAGQYGSFDLWRMEGAANIALSDTFAIRLAGLKTTRDGYSTTIVQRHANEFDGSTLPTIQEIVDTDDLDTTALRFSAVADLTDEFSINVVADWSKADTNGTARVNRGADLVSMGIGGPKTFGNATDCDVVDFYSACADTAPFSVLDVWGVGVTAAYDVTDNMTFKLIYGHRDGDDSFGFDIEGTSVFFNTARFFQSFEQDSVEAQVLGDVGMLKYIAGLYWLSEDASERQFIRGWGAAGCGPVSFPPGTCPSAGPENERLIEGYVTNATKAIYGQGTLALSDTVDLTLGARYTEDEKSIIAGTFLVPNPPFTGRCELTNPSTPNAGSLALCNFQREDTFSHTSWTASLDWEAAENILLYVKAANGYRAGGQNLRAAFTVARQAPFGPETVTDIETGAKTDLLDGRLRLNADYYHSFYDDVQVSLLTQLGDGRLATQVRNFGGADIDGVEMQARYFLSPNFSVDGTASWLNFQFDDPLLAPQFVPDYRYNVGATLDVPANYGTWTLRAGYSYQDDYAVTSFKVVADGNPFATVKGRGLLDGRITLDIEEAGVQLAVFGTNLTDEEYYESPLTGSNVNTDPAISIPTMYLGSSTFNTASVGAPRIVGFEIRKKFGGEYE